MKAGNIKFSLSILIILLISDVFSQNLNNIPDEILENEIANNILIYRIRNNSSLNSVKGSITDEVKPSFLGLLPPNGYKLKLLYKEIKGFKCPGLSNYLFYEVLNENFTYSNESESLKCSGGNVVNQYYLIAYNKEIGRVKYLSGRFFKSSIINDFEIILTEPQSLVNYLIIRTYFLKTKNIIYNGENNGIDIFKAYSNVLGGEIDIELSSNNLEEPLIKFNGSYIKH